MPHPVHIEVGILISDEFSALEPIKRERSSSFRLRPLLLPLSLELPLPVRLGPSNTTRPQFSHAKLLYLFTTPSLNHPTSNLCHNTLILTSTPTPSPAPKPAKPSPLPPSSFVRIRTVTLLLHPSFPRPVQPLTGFLVILPDQSSPASPYLGSRSSLHPSYPVQTPLSRRGRQGATNFISAIAHGPTPSFLAPHLQSRRENKGK